MTKKIAAAGAPEDAEHYSYIDDEGNLVYAGPGVDGFLLSHEESYTISNTSFGEMMKNLKGLDDDVLAALVASGEEL